MPAISEPDAHIWAQFLFSKKRSQANVFVLSWGTVTAPAPCSQACLLPHQLGVLSLHVPPFIYPKTSEGGRWGG